MTSIAVIGCGYVGFSLIKTFKNKFNIIGYDISQERINLLNQQYNYSNVLFTDDETQLNNCNVFIIAVPTNITTNGNINLEHIYKVKNTLTKYIKNNDIIVVESSIYVGGTREIFADFLDKNIYIGFSPERISPGDHEDCENIPKLISGLDKISLYKIYEIYSQVIKKVIQVSSTETAELCKLYENCFRVVNIAYVNEIADLSTQYNIDFNEVVNACKTKPFGFMSFYPSFGIGGFCLPQNPYYLMHNINNPSKTLPILNNSINYLNKRPLLKAKYLSKFKNILIIGAGFKDGQTLTAFSPAITIYNELKKYKKKVILFDEKKEKFDLEELQKYDCLVINNLPKGIDEDLINQYKSLNYGQVFTF